MPTQAQYQDAIAIKNSRLISTNVALEKLKNFLARKTLEIETKIANPAPGITKHKIPKILDWKNNKKSAGSQWQTAIASWKKWVTLINPSKSQRAGHQFVIVLIDFEIQMCDTWATMRGLWEKQSGAQGQIIEK